ncbi:AzlD domain-containing protein [Acidovorax sp.]|uniref:AzlD domain-containing protein n=1 Tax=Acidovorax sp. TaxID=1872122 RepID=UPI003919DE3A
MTAFNGSWLYPAAAIIGLAVITVISRAFFMIPERELPLPDWLKRGLKYAPLAALTAVIAPEILMTQGELIDTLRDARIPAVLCASAYYFWRRGILGTIVVGMVVYLPLHIGWGW